MKDPTDLEEIKDKWYHIENLSSRDHFMLALLQRHSDKFYGAMKGKVELERKLGFGL